MYVNIRKLTKDEIVNDFSASDIGGSSLSEEEFKYIFSALGIWFDYEHALGLGINKPPHAILPNGTHTNFHFHPHDLFANSQIAEILATQLAKKLEVTKKLMKMSKRERYKLQHRTYVIGPSRASLLVAGIAKICSCWQGITYPSVAGEQEWQSLPLPPYNTVQLVCDYIVSYRGLDAIHAAIIEPLNYSQAFIKVKSEVGVVVNLSGKEKLTNDWVVKSLVRVDQKIWVADDCELCRSGSRALSTQDNWSELAVACWREPVE